ncbi:hypothetical protein MMC24_001859 [Lignoscripta atroalba]|nr:hypothetical protein [Lignoscripta atroalba]
MSDSEVTPVSRANTGATHACDHAINLVDTTKPALEQDRGTTEGHPASDLPPGRVSGETLSRRWTKGTLREELVRRKYARWQENRFNDGETTAEPSDNDEGHASTEEANLKKGSARKGRLRDKIPFRSGNKARKADPQREYEVDILYENQRGSFFCGIPLYSSKSLLNFDPSPWQTAAFKDSPVNITNAQLPDPSWQWVWKSWYVDMSHDVDEEGWEYSFSFRYGFAWHGTHPWFHSFVRRRRWLRKRVKKSEVRERKKDDMGNAHMLNPDYFTIHAMADRSRDSSADRMTNNRSSYMSSHRQKSDSEEEEQEINDILALMRALRKATVDRQKIKAIKNFLNHGGDELYYLPDNMAEIMALFIYQTSRRQLLTHLLKVYESTTEHREEHTERGEPESDKERRKIDSLLKAVRSAEEHVGELEFWSDIKVVAEKGHAIEGSDDHPVIHPAWQCLAGGESSRSPGKDDNGNDIHIEKEIKGIPEDAAIDQEPSIVPGGAKEDPRPSSLDKGKGKA